MIVLKGTRKYVRTMHTDQDWNRLVQKLLKMKQLTARKASQYKKVSTFLHMNIGVLQHLFCNIMS